MAIPATPISTTPPSSNPLLDFTGLPRFAAILPSHIQPAIAQLIEEANTTIANLTAVTAPPTWQNFVMPLDDAHERLARAWGIVGHLNGVLNSPEIREAYNGTLPAVTQYWTNVSQNLALYNRYKLLLQTATSAPLTPTPTPTPALTAAQRTVVENEVRDFRLGGAELSDEKKAQYQTVQEELSILMSTFNDNVLDATNAFAHIVTDEAELLGLPADVVQAAKEAAQKNNRAGWKFTLHAPSYMPVMQYANSRTLREKLYRAYMTRASELGSDDKWDNTSVISRILALRQEAARLLGLETFAELSLATKMADTPDEVIAFLTDMAAKAKPFAVNDWAALTAFAVKSGYVESAHDVAAWDVAYLSEKLREQRYAFSDLEVKQYFPEPQVLAGLFRVVETIYGVQMTPAKADVWHPDARFFDVRNLDGGLIGQFYLDLYARDAKRGGAWMDDAINRRRVASGVQHPVAFLTCNFSPPAAVSDGGNIGGIHLGAPALFTHDEVITLFHEFGHGLHQLLTEVDELSISGINGVEWDAVELPSQIMENFCWEWDVLKHMTRHAETGEPLPRALFDKMIAAKNFQAGMGFVRQLEFALFDMRLHSDFDASEASPLQLSNAVRAEVAVVPAPAFNRMPNTFGHIFGGGYAAGYYSYKWAEVLSADAYALFEETGVLSAETGARFRREVLARGSSRPALESFVAFRGRKPASDALLRHNGMKLAA